MAGSTVGAYTSTCVESGGEVAVLDPMAERALELPPWAG
jgi:hypothetical protein